MKKRVIKTNYTCYCDVCGKKFTAKYRNTMYCSDACKQYAYREGYSKKKREENTLELQLLTEKNKEMELSNEKLRLENILQEKKNEYAKEEAKRLQEKNTREILEQNREMKRKQDEDKYYRERQAEQQKLFAVTNLLVNGILNRK